MRRGLVFDKKIKNILCIGLPVWLFLSAMRLVAEPLQDPTIPPGFVGTSTDSAVQDQVPAWKVDSILISKDRRMAVINGQTVRRGDVVDSAKVIGISATAVTLRNNAETFTVKLLPAQIKSAR